MCNASMYAGIFKFVVGMQKNDWCSVCSCGIMRPTSDLSLVRAYVLKLAACFSFHLWPLQQPFTGYLDALRDLLGSANMPTLSSQVSLKAYSITFKHL